MLRIERPSPQIRVSKRHKRLTMQDLVTLWVNRARHLAQQVYLMSMATAPGEHPDKIVKVMHDAVRLLLDNMKILASASLTYSHYGMEANPLFFVPAEATILFAIVEKAVDLFGYHGDEVVEEREVLLDNMCIAQGSLILNPEFLARPIDFPHFVVRDEHLSKIGIYPFAKRTQLGHFFASWDCDRRTFGQRLARYNPHLLPGECYAFENPDKDVVPTEPNTPDGETSLTSHVDWFEVEMDRLVFGQEDKENVAADGEGEVRASASGDEAPGVTVGSSAGA
ncbi:hypothetical protein FB451DRAFT_1414497 [Mycena latifolia]|nr:hypothetical protein FB451DRAFT_1414497 [Mycena latifolia]